MTRHWLQRLRSALGVQDPELPPAARSDAEAFQIYCRGLNLRNSRLAAILLCAGMLATWPLDLRTLGAIPGAVEHFAHLRGLIASGALVVYLLSWIPPLAGRPLLVMLLLSGFGGGVAIYELGQLAGLDRPWPYLAYLVVFSAALPVARPAWRLLHSIVVVASLAVGIAMARGDLLADPMLPTAIRYLAMFTASALILGYVTNSTVRRNFFLARSHERASLAVQELNATLQQRVDEQTRELRRLAAHLESSREDERSRISRELHDELGQELTALRYALALTRQHFEKDPAGIRANFDLLDQLLARTTSTVRHIVTELRPRVLEDLGLGAGVEWLIQRTEEHASITCALRMKPGELQLDAEPSIAAFRILQEALTNVVRHARATRVEVDVERRDDLLLLTVRDDGVGIAPPADADSQRRPGGMGLIGMRERARALGGTFDLDSAPGRGTTIAVTLPMRALRETGMEATP